MNILNIRGKLISINPLPYKINWDKKVGSGLQFNIKQILKPHWQHLLVYEEFRIPGCLFRLDIFNYSDGVVIEISPDKYHTEYNEFFHGSKMGFNQKLKSDFEKREWCKLNKLTLIELDDDGIRNFSANYAKEKYGITL